MHFSRSSAKPGPCCSAPAPRRLRGTEVEEAGAEQGARSEERSRGRRLSPRGLHGPGPGAARERSAPPEPPRTTLRSAASLGES